MYCGVLSLGHCAASRQGNSCDGLQEQGTWLGASFRTHFVFGSHVSMLFLRRRPASRKFVAPGLAFLHGFVGLAELRVVRVTGRLLLQVRSLANPLAKRGLFGIKSLGCLSGRLLFV